MFSRYSEKTAEAYKLYFIFAALIFFIVSAVTSCNEVRYLAGGQTIDAPVEKVQSLIRRSRYSSTEVVAVSYTIIEPGGEKRRESDEVGAGWMADNPQVFGPDDKTISVQYLPGAPEYSRISGHSKPWMVIFFVVASAALLFVSIRFLREFNAHQRRMNAQRR